MSMTTTVGPRATVKSANEVRRAFINFFRARGHNFVPSSSVLPPPDDKWSSLAENLFVNAGMVQFKPFMVGELSPRWTRAVNAQKCIRLGGKHNDLEAVGHDTYHHTFFEMLGNWSFGNTAHLPMAMGHNAVNSDNTFLPPYGREEMCRMAWEFLTDTLHLDPRRLYVTYFDGTAVDSSGGLPPDVETRDAWLRIGVPPDRVLGCSAEHNLWEMGNFNPQSSHNQQQNDDGLPCGPCSEIHIDMVPGRSESVDSTVETAKNVRRLVNANDPSVVELWNLVFMEKQRLPDGSLQDLPFKNVDCGMGFERLVSVVQGVPSAYDTDLFRPQLEQLSAYVEEWSLLEGVKPYQGGASPEDVAYRILVDHCRALAVSLADGVQFGPEHQGKEMRRLLRRCCFFAHQHLGLSWRTTPGALELCVRGACTSLSPHYPQLADAEELCVGEVRVQTRRFWKKMENLAESLRKWARKGGVRGNFVDGKTAFRLHRNGLPVEWMRMLAGKHGIRVDWAGFEATMQKWREQESEAKNKGEEDIGSGNEEGVEVAEKF